MRSINARYNGAKRMTIQNPRKPWKQEHWYTQVHKDKTKRNRPKGYYAIKEEGQTIYTGSINGVLELSTYYCLASNEDKYILKLRRYQHGHKEFGQGEVVSVIARGSLDLNTIIGKKDNPQQRILGTIARLK